MRARAAAVALALACAGAAHETAHAQRSPSDSTAALLSPDWAFRRAGPVLRWNVVTRELKPWRLALVFMFGLLHGLGFAGVLRDLGLPRDQFLTALLTFNLGVEGGQLTVIAAAMIATAAFMRKGWYRQRVVIPASLLIAAIGLYWTVARVLATGY